VFIKSLADIKKLKASKGADIQVWGSSKLVQLLLKNDLVDELRLKIHQLTLGKEKSFLTMARFLQHLHYRKALLQQAKLLLPVSGLEK
jgi:dihydrofolate reductase